MMAQLIDSLLKFNVKIERSGKSQFDRITEASRVPTFSGLGWNGHRLQWLFYADNDVDDDHQVGDVDGVNDQVWGADHISGRWVKSMIAVISRDKVKGVYYSHMMDGVTCS